MKKEKTNQSTGKSLNPVNKSILELKPTNKTSKASVNKFVSKGKNKLEEDTEESNSK